MSTPSGTLYECVEPDCGFATMNRESVFGHEHSSIRVVFVAGLVQYRKARQTGTYVGVYRSAEAGLDDGDGATPWTTVCEEHSQTLACESRKQALYFASAPLDWCQDCSPKEAS